MTTLTISMMLWACATALLLSIGALLVALHSLRQSRKTLSGALSVRLSEIESTTEALIARVKGINSRVSMQILRDKRREQTAPIENATPQDPHDVEAEAKRIRDELNASLAERKFQ